MTVYELAKKMMNDEEFNKGGVMKNEKKYLDQVGLDYEGKDLDAFYAAMTTLCILNKKYAK